MAVHGCETQIGSGWVGHASPIDPWVCQGGQLGLVVNGGRWLGDQLEASLYFLWRNMWRVMTREILCWVKIWVCVLLSRKCKKI